jgi:hypothetical protein
MSKRSTRQPNLSVHRFGLCAAAMAAAFAMLVLPGGARASEGGIVALTPRPNEHVAQSPKLIAMRVAARTSLGESAIVHLIIDGRDVSDAITTTGNIVDYKPKQALAAGEHAIEVSVTDTAGGRLSYTWTFTVDGASSSNASVSRAPAQAAQDAPAPPDGGSASAETLPPSGTDGSDASAMPATQEIYGQQNFYGGFYPIGASPYYWGDNAAFEFIGVPGGYGFLTFSGIPGVFDLFPLGLNSFYAIVPIPIGFLFGSPFVTCHFFAPNGAPTVVVLPTFTIVRHRRGEQPPPVHVPANGRSTALPRTSGSRAAPLHATPAEHVLPVRAMPHVIRIMFMHSGLEARRPLGLGTRTAPHFVRLR